MATVKTLLDGVTSTIIGEPVAIDASIMDKMGSIPILISGVTNATVILEATIATDREVIEGTAQWKTVSGGSWTADIADGFYTPFTHVRGRVTVYTAGTITMRILI